MKLPGLSCRQIGKGNRQETQKINQTTPHGNQKEPAFIEELHAQVTADSTNPKNEVRKARVKDSDLPGFLMVFVCFTEPVAYKGKLFISTLVDHPSAPGFMAGISGQELKLWPFSETWRAGANVVMNWPHET